MGGCLNQGTKSDSACSYAARSGAIRPEVRYANWAGGSRSQTHRRAAKGGFTQDDCYVQVVAPMHYARPPPDPSRTLELLGSFSHYNSVLDNDDVFYLFLQKQKIGAELHIYLEEVRTIRGCLEGLTLMI